MKIPLTAVIDTSVLVSALMSQKGASFAILSDYIERGGFLWVISQPLYDEYANKLAAKFPEIERRAAKNGHAVTPGHIGEVLSYIAKTAAWADVESIVPGMTNDPNDDHIGALAVEMGVNYLVTLDKDFEPMAKGRYTVEVVRPFDFLQALRLAT